jgi:hypothetical protein
MQITLVFSSTSNTSLKTYESKIVGLKLQYPSNWNVETSTSSQNDAIKILFKPNDSYAFSEGLELIVQKLPHRYRLERFVNEQIGGSNFNTYSKALEQETSSYISGIQFMKVQYLLQSKNQDTGITIRGEKYLQYFGVKEIAAYIFTYHANIDRFQLHLPSVEAIIKSLTIINNPINDFVSAFGNIIGEEKYAPIRSCDRIDARYYESNSGLVYVMRSDSMFPSLQEGDIIGLNRTSANKLSIGDIIAYHLPFEDSVVISRVTNIELHTGVTVMVGKSGILSYRGSATDNLTIVTKPDASSESFEPATDEVFPSELIGKLNCILRLP